MTEESTVQAGVKLSVKQDQAALSSIDNLTGEIKDRFERLSSDLGKMVMTPFDNRTIPATKENILRQVTNTIRHLPEITQSKEWEDLQSKLNVFTGTQFTSGKDLTRAKKDLTENFKEFRKVFEQVVDDEITKPLTSGADPKKHPLIYRYILGDKTEGTLQDIKQRTGTILGTVEDEINNIIGTKDQDIKATRNRFMQSYLASSIYALAGIGTSWGRYAAGEQTAFDLSSPEAMYSARKQYEIAGTRLKYQTVGQGVGMVGGLLALLMAGGASMTGGIGGLVPLLFPYIGSQLGGDIGGMMGEFPAKAEERDLKIKTEMAGFGRQGLAAWGSFDIPAARLRARFGGNVRGLGANIGYSDDQMTQFAYQYGSQGAWDRDAFNNSMVFERARGLTAGSTFGMNQMSQFTGQATGDYSNIYRYAQKFDPSMQRLSQTMEKVPQIMSMIANIAGVQADKILGQTEDVMNIPKYLFSNKNYQDVSKQGMQGIQALQGLFQPSTPAGEFIMMSSLGLGTRPLSEVYKRSQMGIMGDDGLQNLKDMTEGMRKSLRLRGIGEENLPMALRQNFSALQGLPFKLIEDLAGAITDTDLAAVQKKIEKEKGGKYIDFTEEAKKNKSGTEDYLAKLNSVMIDAGESVAPVIRSAELFANSMKKTMVTTGEGLNQLTSILNDANSFFVTLKEQYEAADKARLGVSSPNKNQSRIVFDYPMLVQPQKTQ
mgnify:CR=1 FL=1